ncbi:MAG: zinc-binding dehydrogenase [Anaerolineaceae bacterium]
MPIAGAGQRLLRVSVVGLCGSDLHWYEESGIGNTRLDSPLVPGHEFSARTEDGQRIAVDPAVPCGRCELCRKGHPNLCPDVRFAGYGREDGALREFMAWEQSCLFRLPDQISDEEGALLEPLGVAIHAVDLAHFKEGMTAAVFGCGTIGLMIIQLLNRSGAAAVYASDILPHRVDAARALGADRTVLAEEGRASLEINGFTSKRGIDVAFDVSGEAGAVADAFETAVPGGKVILAGIPSDDHTEFQASLARRKGLTIKMVRRMKNTYPRAIQLVGQEKLEIGSLVTGRFPLEQAAEAFESASRRDGIKTVITIGK